MQSELDKMMKELQPIYMLNPFSDFNHILLEQQTGSQQQQPGMDVTGTKLINNYRFCTKVYFVFNFVNNNFFPRNLPEDPVFNPGY